MGFGGCSSPESGKALFFQQKLIFSGRSQQPKISKKYFLCLLIEKSINNRIHYIQRDEVPVIHFLLLGWVSQAKQF